MNFDGKTAIVTGGTRGIGASVAGYLWENGCNVLVTGTSFKNGSGIYPYCQLDFNDKTSLNDFLLYVEQMNTIDILINNAGINHIEAIDCISYNNWDEVIRINLTGPMKLINKVSKKMKKQKYGRIVNISSIWGVIAKEKRSSYAAAKTGLIGLTRASSLDLAKYNILVNAVCPGFTLTELTLKSLNNKEMKELTEQIPLGRMANTEEIAKLITFLCSDENTYITGQAITIDGGFTIK